MRHDNGLGRFSRQPPWVRAAAALVSGFLGSCTFAIVAEGLLESSQREPGYPLSAPFSDAFVGVFVIGGGLLGLVTGWVTRRCVPFAFGMTLPLPLTLLIEVSRDPTSHNLFPFEILLIWIPAFVVTYAAALIGWFTSPTDADAG